MVMAGPFVPGDFQRFVPADKKLSAEWVKSLFERGTPTIYRGTQLRYIGMPVGGICAGQLYLGGDGRLWHWDIFNNIKGTGSGHYTEPMIPTGGPAQGFALRILSGAPQETRPLDAKGFPDVTFCGQYPIGTVTYADPKFPLRTTLEAFSPFIPLDLEDSSLPATVMKFTVKNTSSAPVEAELGGWLQNLIAHKSGQLFSVVRINRAKSADGATMLECSIREAVSTREQKDRPAIPFDNFERGEWEKWKAEGKAFGSGPAAAEDAPTNQKLKGYEGKRLVNSLGLGGEAATGKLTSAPFTIERRFINFLIGGGNSMRPDGLVDAGMNLLVEGKVVRNATGTNSDALSQTSWDVGELEGRTAVLEILDNVTGGWGHIDVDQIEFADHSPLVTGSASEQPDAGSLALAMLDSAPGDRVTPLLQGNPEQSCFTTAQDAKEIERAVGSDEGNRMTGSVIRPFKLDPGASREITFVLAWNFPNLVFPLTFNAGQAPGAKTIVEKGRYYATKFDSAAAVVGCVSKNAPRLIGGTELWRDTWYDSTLPYWLLDRTLANASILATSTCLRFADGRFYGWEGVGCCAGTCTHVWHYEQAMGRLFPELDILLRERMDFNPQTAFNEKTGVIGHRGDVNLAAAADGQAGTILRAYRDYLVSPDTEFLKRNWPQIKHATEWMMSLDSDRDGILDKPQSNTLDGTWYGKIPWITSLGLAAVAASRQMALTMGDTAFADICKQFVGVGKANFEKTFWNGEYFEQIHDPSKLEHVGSYNGCEIDQVFGQGWAFQVGLDRVLPEEKTKEALNAIWKYNFTPDVGPYRKERPAGRWYAMPGEGGTLMCSWPRGDKLRVTKGFDFYFNECMNGFEHQVAGHMIWEGAPGSEMVKQGLAIERAVHDRYDGSKRNPWNEIECGDHYARSMASYGVFLAACGFTYDGPAGRIGFAPRLTPENFKAAFTAAEGWGSYSQKQTGKEMTAALVLKYGKLRLTQVDLVPPQGVAPTEVRATLDGKSLAASLKSSDGQSRVVFDQPLQMAAKQTLEVALK
jgi:uncharacterized protein (DUF608 family)